MSRDVIDERRTRMLFGLQNQFHRPRRATFVSWVVGGALVLPAVFWAGNGRPWLGAMVGAVFVLFAMFGIVRLATGARTVPIRTALIGGAIGVLVLFVAAFVILGIAFSGPFIADGR